MELNLENKEGVAAPKTLQESLKLLGENTGARIQRAPADSCRDARSLSALLAPV
jgi:hypothetical protein